MSEPKSTSGKTSRPQCEGCGLRPATHAGSKAGTKVLVCTRCRPGFLRNGWRV